MKLYEKFVIREPLLDKNKIYNLYESEDYKKKLSKEFSEKYMQESLLVGTESLYHYLKNNKCDQFNDNFYLSLSRYYLRMASRSTPYGLFAGITYGEFTGKSYQSKNNKDVIVSRHWLKNVINIIEQSQGIDSTLRMYTNNTMEKKADYFSLGKISGKSEVRQVLNKSKIIDKLLTLFKDGESVSDVISKFEFNLAEKVLFLIKCLLQYGYLISELNASNVNASNDLTRIIANNNIDNENRDKIININNLISKYECIDLGDGIEIYQEILKKMSSISKSKSYLIINHKIQKSDYTEEFDIEKIDNVIKKISFLSNLKVMDPLEEIEINFIHKYGMYNEVALKDFHRELNVTSTLQKFNYMDFQQIKTYLDFIGRKIQYGTIEKKNIELTDNDIQYLENSLRRFNMKKINDGFDVKISIIEEGVRKFKISNNSFANTFGSYTGRFNKYELNNPTKHYTSSQYISAEVDIIPENYADIAVTYLIPKYTISIEGNNRNPNTILLDDLVIGVDADGIYLKSTSLDKKILPIFSNKLYYTNFTENKYLIFLFMFGEYLTAHPKNLFIGYFEELPYIPRIEYKYVILMNETWKISKREYLLNHFDKFSFNTFIQDFIIRNRLPEYVHLLEGDMELPINTKSELGISLIEQEFSKKADDSYVVLTEAPEINNRRGDKNRDFIFSVEPEIENSENKNTTIFKEKVVLKDTYDYFTIDYEKGLNTKITTKIFDFIYTYGAMNAFFVNYIRDNNESLRVRYFKKNESLRDALKKLLNDMYLEKEILGYSEDMFIPEINRYGGLSVYEDIYRYFALDTEFYFNCQKDSWYRSLSLVDKGIFVVFNVMFDFFDDYNDAKEFISRSYKKIKENHVHFKKERECFKILANKIADYRMEKKREELYINKRQQASVINQGLHTYSDDYLDYVYQSVLHMSINRFFGVDTIFENTVKEIANYCFHNLKYRLDIKEEYIELY